MPSQQEDHAILIPRLETPLRPIVRVEAFAFRAPIEEPVVTSFGIMGDRPAVLLRVEDGDGATGWGEAWCNFPSCGAEHRARLATTTVGPLLIRGCFESPAAAFQSLTAATRVLALQSGEPGPLAQVLAGLDIALWDLAARRAGQPLYRFLGGGRREHVPAYASGINPKGAPRTVARSRGEGHTAFKVKVGFGLDQDLAAVAAVHAELSADEAFMLDANQAWALDDAIEAAAALERFRPRWLEEPLPADRPPAEWRRLAAATAIPLAAGENLRGHDAFRQAIEDAHLGVIQPDACKWGGVTGCLAVAREALEAGRRYCPHYLGGGIGLVASAHLLAAAGGDGMLEVDVNPNPLREILATPFPAIAAGRFMMPAGPGLGVEPDLPQARRWLTLHEECRGRGGNA